MRSRSRSCVITLGNGGVARSGAAQVLEEFATCKHALSAYSYTEIGNVGDADYNMRELVYSKTNAIRTL